MGKKWYSVSCLDADRSISIINGVKMSYKLEILYNNRLDAKKGKPKLIPLKKNMST